MFPNVLLLCSFRPSSSRNKKKANRGKLETDVGDQRHLQFPVKPNGRVAVDELDKYASHPYEFSPYSREENKSNGRKKVSNFSDVIQRVAASCLLRPLSASWQDSGELPPEISEEQEEQFDQYYKGQVLVDEEEEEGSHERTKELGVLVNQMFDAVLAVKRAYIGLHEAHCTWDPERMRAADVAVVDELMRLGVLGERWRRRGMTMGKEDGSGGWKTRRAGGGSGPREVVLPYEAVVEELRRDVKARGKEVDKLKEKLSVASFGRKGRFQPKRKVSCCHGLVAASPESELFVSTMCQVREASKSFTSLLLSLMHAAHWDITAAVRSIEASTAAASSMNSAHHAKFALESYISRKIFHGFDHETFFMDRSLSSLLSSEQYRHDCFTQYWDMKSIDPIEMLETLPACNFSKFCSRKYLSMIHPKMEESFFGSLELQRQVMAGKHPRIQFYSDFLGLAKAVWLLHLLAFSLNPPPSLFDAVRGAEFHPQYMESVVKFAMEQVPTGKTVGFPVSPGFKLGNGTVIKARVYFGIWVMRVMFKQHITEGGRKKYDIYS